LVWVECIGAMGNHVLSKVLHDWFCLDMEVVQHHWPNNCMMLLLMHVKKVLLLEAWREQVEMSYGKKPSGGPRMVSAC